VLRNRLGLIGAKFGGGLGQCGACTVTVEGLGTPDKPHPIDLVARRREPPLGGGEASSTPVAAALAHAVHDACGARLRTVPFTPQRVREAMA
jgi:hypothetical protein